MAKAINSMKRVDDKGRVYYMEYTGNYYLLERLAVKAVSPGCTTFLTKNLKGDHLFCRNYDFSHYRYNKKGTPEDITGLILIVKSLNKRAKYTSIGIVDGFWLDGKGRYFEGTPDDGTTDLTMFAAAPLAVMDGMNDQGLAVSIMHLPTENEWHEVEWKPYDELTDEEKEIAIVTDVPGDEPKRLDATVKKGAYALNTADKKRWQVNKNLSVNQQSPGKKTMLHPILMRHMLDYCKDASEAVELAKSVNVKSALPDNDYHIFIADASGTSLMLEWIDNELKVIETSHGTNFYLGREDHYGYGYERNNLARACLEKYKNGMSDKMAMEMLEIASQNVVEGSDVGFTQWSSLYNLDKLEMKVSVFLDYDTAFEYKL